MIFSTVEIVEDDLSEPELCLRGEYGKREKREESQWLPSDKRDDLFFSQTVCSKTLPTFQSTSGLRREAIFIFLFGLLSMEVDWVICSSSRLFLRISKALGMSFDWIQPCVEDFSKILPGEDSLCLMASWRQRRKIEGNPSGVASPGLTLVSSAIWRMIAFLECSLRLIGERPGSGAWSIHFSFFQRTQMALAVLRLEPESPLSLRGKRETGFEREDSSRWLKLLLSQEPTAFKVRFWDEKRSCQLKVLISNL